MLHASRVAVRPLTWAAALRSWCPRQACWSRAARPRARPVGLPYLAIRCRSRRRLDRTPRRRRALRSAAPRRRWRSHAGVLGVGVFATLLSASSVQKYTVASTSWEKRPISSASTVTDSRLARLGLQGDGESFVGEQRRIDPPRQITQVLQRCAGGSLELSQQRPCLVGIAIDHLLRELQLDSQRDQLLLGAVVDVALESLGALVLGRHDAAARVRRSRTSRTFRSARPAWAARPVMSRCSRHPSDLSRASTA